MRKSVVEKFLMSSIFVALNFVTIVSTQAHGSTFEIKYINSLDQYVRQKKYRDPKPASEMFVNICLAAKDHAGLDTVNRKVNLLSAHPEDDYLLTCNTVPIAYILCDWAGRNPTILLETNKYMSEYRMATLFKKEVLKVPESCADALEKDPQNFELSSKYFVALIQSKCYNSVKESHIAELSKKELLNICIAARKKFNEELVFEDNEVENPQKFSFIFEKNRKEQLEEHVAVKCPTFVAMYLYFENLRKNENVTVVFVKQIDENSKTKLINQIDPRP